MYRIVPDPVTYDQVAALPQEALRSYSEVLATLALTPWNGRPQHRDNPNAAVRRWSFGPDVAGQVIYLILELTDHREVHLLFVQWLG